MGPILRVAVCQTHAVRGDPAANAARLSEKVRTLAALPKPPQLVLFPELALSGYPVGAEAYRLSRGEAEARAQVAEAAGEARLAVLVGSVEDDPLMAGTLYDTLYLFGADGLEKARYRKRFLWQAEQLAFTRGRDPVVAQVFGVRLGLGVCWDMGFPEWSRPLAWGGAQVLMVAAAWDRGDIDLFELFARARGAENGCYLVVANRVGQDARIMFGGRSQVVGPDGRVLARAGTRDEATLLVDLDLGRIAAERAERSPYFRDLAAAQGKLG